MQHPLVSIVMPSLNQARFIPESIKSVLSQSYENLELIISDGNSSDETPDILTDMSKNDPRIRWVSEPDLGPANAINKALHKVRGEVIGWLNSDDVYTENAIQSAVQTLQGNPDLIMCYGHGEHINQDGNRLDAYPTLPPEAGFKGFRESCFICQPTAFFKATLPVLIGYLNQEIQVSFDYDYWLRVFRVMPERVGFIDKVQAQSRLHDACLTESQRDIVALEGLKLSRQYFGTAESHWAVTRMHEFESSYTSAPQKEKDELYSAAVKFLETAQEYIDKQQYLSLKTLLLSLRD